MWGANISCVVCIGSNYYILKLEPRNMGWAVRLDAIECANEYDLWWGVKCVEIYAIFAWKFNS